MEAALDWDNLYQGGANKKTRPYIWRLSLEEFSSTWTAKSSCIQSSRKITWKILDDTLHTVDVFNI